ncbi:MAG TPA: IS110 family transposase [Thermomicrobiales bacterium]|jgi:transposase
MGDERVAYRLFVGVDIAADTFTAAWLAPGGQPAAPFTGEQTPAGFDALHHRLQATGVPPGATLLVLEATGNYWVALAVALHEAGYRVAVVNPRQAHHFAKAPLRRAKTGALDARDLAQLAAALQPAPWSPPPAVYHEVRQRLVARDGLLSMRTQARNQRHALLQWPVVVDAVRQHLDELIADLDRRIAALEREIAAALAGSVWAESLACVASAPGIGLITAAWLLVGTLNFALCPGPESLAAYAGLVPVPRESGRSVRGRPRIGHDGNGRLRTALYLATLSAARHNPAIRALFQRLRAAGKPLKVARCAAARKLLHQAWALATKRQRFDPHHGQTQGGVTAELAA